MPFDDWEERTVRANGQRIHLWIAGTSGPLVLLVHGFPESWYSWRHQMDALANAGYRAVAMDPRGYGRSSKPADVAAYRITESVADCAGVVEALGETNCVIVGHDYGAPVAWASAWTRPDVFRAVAALSLPFGGRGQSALPGNPFGARRPMEVARELAGPDMLFYQEYFRLPGGVAEAEIEEDVRSWVISGLYSLSADRPLPAELVGVDLTSLPPDFLREFVRATMCVPRTEGFGTRLELPEKLPDWIDQDEVDFLVDELEHTGLTGPLNYYRALDLNWEALGAYEGRPVTVPALFIGGDRDVATIWSQEAIARITEHVPDLRGSVILADCGHWIQQERPEAVNRELLGFLGGL
ncbi:alpha/beta hydrolase [Streptomyces sp. NPDC051985]|uniref:alpha/beta fold hydrolase n=1 Tax=Streptomyces sp. NPDC051985 TaxID=3155807 RepID=UPI0034297B10